MCKFWAWIQQARKQPAALTVMCRKTVLEQLFAAIKQKCLQQDPQSSMLTEDDDVCLKPIKKHNIKQHWHQAHLLTAIDELPVPDSCKQILHYLNYKMHCRTQESVTIRSNHQMVHLVKGILI